MTKPANLRKLNPNRDGGFRCPVCSGPSAVIDSRQSPEGIRRRRACHEGHRFRTYEVLTNSEHDLSGLLAKIGRALAELQDLRIAVSGMLDTGAPGRAGSYTSLSDIPEMKMLPTPFLVGQDGELYPSEHNEEIDHVSC